MFVLRRSRYYLLLLFMKQLFAEKIHFSKWIITDNGDAIYAFETVLKKGIKDCVEICKSKKECKYINYDKAALSCSLIGEDAGIQAELMAQPMRRFIFGNKSEWSMEQYGACNECEGHGVCGKEEQPNDIYSVCQNSSCGPPMKKPLAVVFGNMFSTGDTVKYVCDEGYIPIIDSALNSSTIQQQLPQRPYVSAVCQRDGSWNVPEFQCIPKCSTTTYNSGLVNRARGKQVTLSSQYDADSPGKLMVDGNVSNTWPCACTLIESYPWAIIDLGRSYTIHSIYVINRHCCPERLHSLRIQIGDDVTNLNNVGHHDGAIGKDFTFMIQDGTRGRYVKMQIEAFQYLTICELEVCSTE